MPGDMILGIRGYKVMRLPDRTKGTLSPPARPLGPLPTLPGRSILPGVPGMCSLILSPCPRLIFSFSLSNPRASVGFLHLEVLAPLSPAVCLWAPCFPPLACFLICKWGITVFLHKGFGSTQLGAGQRAGAHQRRSTSFPHRSGLQGERRVPLPALLFPLVPEFSPQPPSKKGCCGSLLHGNCGVVVMGTHTGSFRRVMEHWP